MRYTFFYAAPTDIVPVLRRFEANAPLKFVQTDILPSPNREIYLDSSELPQPGIANRSSGGACRRYIVSQRDTKNVLYSAKTKDGRQLWTVRNGDNEETVLLTLAGLWTTGTLLEGQMDTLHDTPAAQKLMRWFLSSLQQEAFTKVEKCWLGPEALAMLKAGKRLTQAEQAPPECDIKWLGSMSA